MNNCNCKVAGSVAPSSPFNTATNCGQCPKGLTTVNIPASKGTDLPGQPLAPVMGAYQNTVVTYAATGSVYLYDEDGVYTNLTGDKVLPVLAELQGQMAQLTTDVASNTSGLETEKADRVSGQTTLQTAIDALQAALTAETAARTDTDATLTSQIETLQGQATDSAQGLTAETEARTEAVTNLQNQLDALQTGKQDTLISGTNIKTINGQTLVGEGNIDITGGGGAEVDVVQQTGTSTTAVMSQNAVTEAIQATSSAIDQSLDQLTAQLATKQNELVSGTNIKTINGESILGDGDLAISGSGTLDYAYYPITFTLTSFQHTTATPTLINGMSYLIKYGEMWLFSPQFELNYIKTIGTGNPTQIVVSCPLPSGVTPPKASRRQLMAGVNITHANGDGTNPTYDSVSVIVPVSVNVPNDSEGEIVMSFLLERTGSATNFRVIMQQPVILIPLPEE